MIYTGINGVIVVTNNYVITPGNDKPTPSFIAEPASMMKRNIKVLFKRFSQKQRFHLGQISLSSWRLSVRGIFVSRHQISVRLALKQMLRI